MKQVALVTGASRGIGRAIAVALAKVGYAVIINYNGNEVKALETLELCQKYSENCAIFKANVANKADVETLASFILEKYQRIDLIVNNAGITKDNLVLRMTNEDFASVIQTNLESQFYVIKAFTRQLFRQKSGNIINISSVVGINGNIGQANYAASKAGIIGLTKSLAKEFAERNVRVNAVAPGFIKTDMTDALNEEVMNKVKQQIPLKFLGEPEDIANLVVFLSSEKARYITGQVITCDGGMAI